MKEVIRNEKGRVIGYRLSEPHGAATYLKTSGQVVARVRNNTTLDHKGSVKGLGDQGLRLFGQ